MSELFKQISAHLEFFGYSVKYDEGILKTQHGSKPIFWVLNIAGGAFFQALFRLGPGAVADRAALLDFLNKANGIAAIGRYRTVEGSMVVEAWYPDNYSKQSFGTFLAQYLADLNGPASELQPLTAKLF